ncbi:MAG: Lrp/AsnC family transcriptional regulator [Rhizobiaceae bacterium]
MAFSPRLQRLVAPLRPACQNALRTRPKRSARIRFQRMRVSLFQPFDPLPISAHFPYCRFMTKSELDEIDLKILRIIQREPDRNINEVAEAVGLSHTPCWRRIKKMQEAGIIRGRITLIDAQKVGMDVSIFVFVRLERHSPGVLEDFEAATLKIPEILQCYTMSGEFDYLLRVVVPTVRDYEKTIKGKLLKLPNVGMLNSSFALNEIKNDSALPI